MIDAHCHLYEGGDIEAEVQRFKDVGGEAMICCGAGVESSQRAIEIANQHENVWATVGIHPEENPKFETLSTKQTLKSELLKLLKQPKVVAVGECGLDSENNEEVELFKFNIDLAKETGLPLVVHCRNMFERVFEILDYDKVQMHCFTGNMEQMRECVRREWYVSFGGIVTFKSSHELRKVVREVPRERILVETDSPYLAPEPVRGTVNQPANVKYVLNCLAKIRGGDMEKTTSENARRLFGL